MSGREERAFGLDHSLHASFFEVKMSGVTIRAWTASACLLTSYDYGTPKGVVSY